MAPTNTFITGCEVNGKSKQQQEEDLIGNLEKDEEHFNEMLAEIVEA